MARLCKPKEQASYSSEVLEVPEWKQQLSALGVDSETIGVTEDDVFDCMVDLWKRQIKPTVSVLAQQVRAPRRTVSDRVSALVNKGRVIKVSGTDTPGRVLYVPRVKEIANHG